MLGVLPPFVGLSMSSMSSLWTAYLAGAMLEQDERHPDDLRQLRREAGAWERELRRRGRRPRASHAGWVGRVVKIHDIT